MEKDTTVLFQLEPPPCASLSLRYYTEEKTIRKRVGAAEKDLVQCLQSLEVEVAAQAQPQQLESNQSQTLYVKNDI